MRKTPVRSPRLILGFLLFSTVLLIRFARLNHSYLNAGNRDRSRLDLRISASFASQSRLSLYHVWVEDVRLCVQYCAAIITRHQKKSLLLKIFDLQGRNIRGHFYPPPPPRFVWKLRCPRFPREQPRACQFLVNTTRSFSKSGRHHSLLRSS